MTKTYEDGKAEGLVEGKLIAIEDMQVRQNTRLDGHNVRISALEKTSYSLIAIILFIEFAPQLKAFFNG